MPKIVAHGLWELGRRPDQIVAVRADLDANVPVAREEMIRYTPKNPFERFPDGRPKVPDALLERVKTMSVEEAWGILRSKGYPNQHAVGFEILHPGQKLVGRALTAKYLPFREDLDGVVIGEAKAAGKAPGSTQHVVD